MIGIISSFIEMHLLIANHRIRRFTGEIPAIFEGIRKVGYLSVVVKETGRNGLQCQTTIEGISKVGYLSVVVKETGRNGLQCQTTIEGVLKNGYLRIVGK